MRLQTSFNKIKATTLGLLLAAALAGFAVNADEIELQYDGITLDANLEMAEGKSYADGIALILHGMMAHNKMELIETMQLALLDQGFSSLAFNLSLGIDKRHGFFDCNQDHSHLQEDAMDEIAAWVAWLKQMGSEQIVLISHSRGANQAMVYTARQRNPEVTQLVMLAPGVDDLKSQYENRFGEVFDKNLARMYDLASSGRGNEAIDGIDFWYCPKARVTPRSFLSYYGEQSPFRQFSAQLEKIAVPTLVITGTHDEVEPHVANRVRPFVGKGLIHLQVIEGAGHFFRDFNIDEAVEAVVAFIDETS